MNLKKIVIHHDTQQAINPLKEFWEALREDEISKRTPFTIVDIEGNALDPTKAVEACANYLRTVWGNADPYEITFEGNTECSEPPDSHNTQDVRCSLNSTELLLHHSSTQTASAKAVQSVD